MYCATVVNTYTCSNGVGTTCDKQAVSLLHLNANAVCAPSEYVAITSAEYDALAIETSPFVLDNASAVALVGATLSVWAVGFVIRWIIQTVRSRSESENHEI